LATAEVDLFCHRLVFLPYEVLVENRFYKSTDVWMFGCLVWQILTGREPYWEIANVDEVVAEITQRKLSLSDKFSMLLLPTELRKCLAECHQIEHLYRLNFGDILDVLLQLYRKKGYIVQEVEVTSLKGDAGNYTQNDENNNNKKTDNNKSRSVVNNYITPLV